MSGAEKSPGSAKSVNELNRDLFTRQPDDRFQDPLEARKKAMDYLARREYGQRELERKLVTAGFDQAVAIAAVSQLCTDGLQDDRRFAEAFARSRVNQGKGPVRILLDLDQRGVASQLVDEVLAEMSVDWFALAIDVRHKKFGAVLPTDFKDKTRQMRFLQYRGFEQGHIQAAMNEINAAGSY
jgi:regulatory protein